MAKIQKVQPLVLSALVNNPETRTDDFLLVLEVYKNFITADMKLETVFLEHKRLGLPCFTSISRTRRKLQKKYPELVHKGTAIMRATAEKDYKAYAYSKEA